MEYIRSLLFCKKNCEFFFLDTNIDFMNDKEIQDQLSFMSHKIKNSNSRWRILCGHHPWRSVGGHGNANFKMDKFFNDLVSTTFKIHLYMCGHDHCKNLILKNILKIKLKYH